MLDIINVASQSASQRTDQPLAESPSQQGGQTALEAEDTIQVKACYAIDKVYKQLPDEALRHLTKAKVMYKPMNAGISNIRSTGCKPKSWGLNYPAITFLMNGDTI